LKTKLSELLKRPGYRYLIIGGSVYLLEVVVIFAAQAAGASAITAVGLSFWIGLIISFALQKLVTFSDKRLQHKVLIPQVLAFSILVLFNFGFTVLVTRLLASAIPAVTPPPRIRLRRAAFGCSGFELSLSAMVVSACGIATPVPKVRFLLC